MPTVAPKTSEEISQVTGLYRTLRDNVKTSADVEALFMGKPELKKWIALRPDQMPYVNSSSQKGNRWFAPLAVAIRAFEIATITTLLDHAPDKQEALQALYDALKSLPPSSTIRYGPVPFAVFRPTSLLVIDSLSANPVERDQCARSLVRTALAVPFRYYNDDPASQHLLPFIRDVNMRMGANSSWLIDDCSSDATRDVAVSPIAAATFVLQHSDVLRELLQIRKQQRERHGLDPAGLLLPASRQMPHNDSSHRGHRWFAPLAVVVRAFEIATVTTLLDNAPDKQEALQALSEVLKSLPSSSTSDYGPVRFCAFRLAALLVIDSFSANPVERDRCARSLVHLALTLRFDLRNQNESSFVSQHLLPFIIDIKERMGANSSWLIDDCSTDATREDDVSLMVDAAFALQHYSSVLRELLEIRKQQRERHGLDPAELPLPASHQMPHNGSSRRGHRWFAPLAVVVRAFEIATITTLLDHAPDKQEALQALYEVLKSLPSSSTSDYGPVPFAVFRPGALLVIDALAANPVERDRCARSLVYLALTLRFDLRNQNESSFVSQHLLPFIIDVNERMGANSWLIDDCSTDATRDIGVSPITAATFVLQHSDVLRELLQIRKQQRERHGLDPAGLLIPLSGFGDDSRNWFSHMVDYRTNTLEQNLVTARVLVEYGVDLFHSHAFRTVLLHRQFPVSFVELMLQHGAPLGKLWSGKGETALHLLVAPDCTYDTTTVRDRSTRPASERVELIQLFLRYGANPNARDDAGRTPLHFSLKPAQAFSDAEIKTIMQSLIDAGANVNATLHDDSLRTPLMVKCGAGGGDYFIVNKVEIGVLLENGARIDLVDSGGKTALHYALSLSNNQFQQFQTTNNREETVRMLLDAGRVPNVLDSSGSSPFHLWVGSHLNYRPFASFMEVAQSFVNAGADPNLRDGNGNTALMLLAKIASHFSADEVQAFAELLLEEGGADPTIADNDGKLPAGMYPMAPRSLEKTIQRFLKNKERAKLLEQRAAAAEAKKANARKKKAHADNGATKAGK